MATIKGDPSERQFLDNLIEWEVSSEIICPTQGYVENWNWVHLTLKIVVRLEFLNWIKVKYCL